MVNNKYDVAIIGSGPAGMTAAIYVGRTDLSVVYIEKNVPGGKLVYTSKIENYPGYQSIYGPDLSIQMWNHVNETQATYKHGEVVKIEIVDSMYKELIFANNETILAKKVIIASGKQENIPDIVGIHKYFNKGVSYCAICDGPIYKGKPVAVIGGGYSAVEEATFLSSVASEVHLFLRRDKFRAVGHELRDLLERKNVIVHKKTQIKEIKGDEVVNKIIYQENDNDVMLDMKISAVFPYIGSSAMSDFAKDLGIVDEDGYISVDEFFETKVHGVYAIGDIVNKKIKQIITAANDGAIAAKHAIDNIIN
ncbi:MAG: FAD-dependent oxidoreductase [Mycoplasma sp.]|nr:FAD-dependent oxidoreductase [Mycoplasma sp.]